jgi:hypothetical protein
MTLVLNLIEREHEEYYVMERYEYIEMHDEILADGYKSEHIQDYINKYPSTYRKVVKSIDVGAPRVYDITKDYIAIEMGRERQIKCRRLLFRILKDKAQQWWD